MSQLLNFCKSAYSHSGNSRSDFKNTTSKYCLS